MLAGIESLSSKLHCFKENASKKSNIKIICVKQEKLFLSYAIFSVYSSRRIINILKYLIIIKNN